jgi:hypothetical protein
MKNRGATAHMPVLPAAQVRGRGIKLSRRPGRIFPLQRSVGCRKLAGVFTNPLDRCKFPRQRRPRPRFLGPPTQQDYQPGPEAQSQQGEHHQSCRGEPMLFDPHLEAFPPGTGGRQHRTLVEVPAQILCQRTG